MARRTAVTDVLEFLEQLYLIFVNCNLADSGDVYVALGRMWGLVDRLEAMALQHATKAAKDQYYENVLLPRARRRQELLAEIVPAPRTDKDGFPW